MTQFQQWQLAHYKQRIAEEKAKGNWKAVSFLRQNYSGLKKAANATK